MSNAQFHPSAPKWEHLTDSCVGKERAKEVDENGLGCFHISPHKTSDTLNGWSFIFQLENFQNRRVHGWVFCVLFGRVVSCSHQMFKTVRKLSSWGTEKSGYTITLESQ